MGRLVIANLGTSHARRLVGLVAACLVSWQAVGILPALSRTSPACCCLRLLAQKRTCPVCKHAKEVESGQPLLKTCGLHDPTSTPRAFFLPATPAPIVGKVLAAKQPLPEDEVAPLAPAEAPDVPTPPPLA